MHPPQPARVEERQVGGDRSGGRRAQLHCVNVVSAEGREVEVRTRHDGQLGTEPVPVLFRDAVNVSGALEQNVVAADREAVPEQLCGHEHPLFVRDRYEKASPRNACDETRVATGEKNIWIINIKMNPVSGEELTRYVRENTKEYPIVISSPYVIKTGNVDRGGRVPDFLVTEYDLEFYTGLVRSIVSDGAFADKNSPSSSLDKISLFLKHSIPIINTMFNTDQMNEDWKVFDEWVRDYKSRCYNSKNYCEGTECYTNISVVPYFIGDCREHEIVLHFMLKIYLSETNVTDVEVRSLYATYHYPTSSGDIPDYDHTHPVLIHEGNVYNVDALDFIYTSYVTKKWTPLGLYEYTGSKGKTSYVLKWNEGDDQREVFGSPTSFSSTPVVKMNASALGNEIVFYSQPCGDDVCSTSRNPSLLLTSLRGNPDAFWNNKMKRLEDCLARNGQTAGAKGNHKKSKTGPKNVSKTKSSKKYVKTPLKDGNDRVIYNRVGDKGSSQYVRRKDKSGSYVYRKI